MLAAPDTGLQHPRYHLQVYGRKTDEDEEKKIEAAPAAAAGNGNGVPAQVSLSHLNAACSCTAHVMHPEGTPGSACSYWAGVHFMQELAPLG